ncbi:MAG TPA: type VI secretion system tip protein TssI/VgrG [Minicystis sp.]|nr:type VI secretion system tip protein TssI/VgrG [Minicystis sp.]
MEGQSSVTHHARGQRDGGVPVHPAGRLLSARVRAGDALDVREFSVRERMSAVFEVRLVVLSPDPHLDFDAIVGHEASFALRAHGASPAGERVWTGLCSDLQQTATEPSGLSTYELTLVPVLWLLTQRRNHRMFQQMSELDIAKKLLAEWGITPRVHATRAYKTRKYRVQYGESDYAFLCRMLEDAGISFYFEHGDAGTELVLDDAPEKRERRAPALPFADNPAVGGRFEEHVTKLRVGQRVRPGRYTIRDHDTRLPPTLPLLASAVARQGTVEERLESFHYAPGAFHFGTDKGEATPHADDRGRSRTDVDEGRGVAERRLEAQRGDARTIAFETNATDVAPGVVVEVRDHARADLGAGLLVVASRFDGTVDGPWEHACEARFANVPHRPPLETAKPRATGVEYATVVGPAGEEIHTDEFGRVRVHFHWDRESQMNEASSCWIPVSQSWGGAGYGGSNLPRVGQEVLVEFVGGDPDKPVVVGRVYTKLQATPYKLPDNKTQSGWRSNSTQKTGGYNEIMFEDAAGRELFRVQAEKDLAKLVKHDESVTIGNDRQKLVKNDDKLTVLNDRTKVVQNDEDVTIGRDRTKLVKNDDALTVGNDRTELVQMSSREVVGQNRTRSVGVNESVTIGANHTVSVGSDQSVQIGGDHATDVGGSHTTSIGGAHALTVALASAETVGAVKALTVGGAYEVNVGGVMQTNVTLMSTESVGIAKSVTAGKALELVCGKSKISMDAEGKITLAIEGGATVTLDKANINVDAGSGGTITIQGGPNVHINPK